MLSSLSMECVCLQEQSIYSMCFNTKVDIDLAQSAFANARAHYETKKTSAVKEQKTIEASAQV